MTDHTNAPTFAQTPRIKKRNAAEKRFKGYGLTAIAIALTMLVILMGLEVSKERMTRCLKKLQPSKCNM